MFEYARPWLIHAFKNVKGRHTGVSEAVNDSVEDVINLGDELPLPAYLPSFFKPNPMMVRTLAERHTNEKEKQKEAKNSDQRVYDCEQNTDMNNVTRPTTVASTSQQEIYSTNNATYSTAQVTLTNNEMNTNNNQVSSENDPKCDQNKLYTENIVQHSGAIVSEDENESEVLKHDGSEPFKTLIGKVISPFKAPNISSLVSDSENEDTVQNKICKSILSSVNEKEMISSSATSNKDVCKNVDMVIPAKEMSIAETTNDTAENVSPYISKSRTNEIVLAESGCLEMLTDISSGDEQMLWQKYTGKNNGDYSDEDNEADGCDVLETPPNRLPPPSSKNLLHKAPERPVSQPVEVTDGELFHSPPPVYRFQETISVKKEENSLSDNKELNTTAHELILLKEEDISDTSDFQVGTTQVSIQPIQTITTLPQNQNFVVLPQERLLSGNLQQVLVTERMQQHPVQGQQIRLVQNKAFQQQPISIGTTTQQLLTTTAAMTNQSSHLVPSMIMQQTNQESQCASVNKQCETHQQRLLTETRPNDSDKLSCITYYPERGQEMGMISSIVPSSQQQIIKANKSTQQQQELSSGEPLNANTVSAEEHSNKRLRLNLNRDPADDSEQIQYLLNPPTPGGTTYNSKGVRFRMPTNIQKPSTLTGPRTPMNIHFQGPTMPSSSNCQQKPITNLVIKSDDSPKTNVNRRTLTPLLKMHEYIHRDKNASYQYIHYDKHLKPHAVEISEESILPLYNKSVGSEEQTTGLDQQTIHAEHQDVNKHDIVHLLTDDGEPVTVNFSPVTVDPVNIKDEKKEHLSHSPNVGSAVGSSTFALESSRKLNAERYPGTPTLPQKLNFSPQPKLEDEGDNIKDPEPVYINVSHKVVSTEFDESDIEFDHDDIRKIRAEIRESYVKNKSSVVQLGVNEYDKLDGRSTSSDNLDNESIVIEDAKSKKAISVIEKNENSEQFISTLKPDNLTSGFPPVSGMKRLDAEGTISQGSPNKQGEVLNLEKLDFHKHLQSLFEISGNLKTPIKLQLPPGVNIPISFGPNKVKVVTMGEAKKLGIVNQAQGSSQKKDSIVIDNVQKHQSDMLKHQVLPTSSTIHTPQQTVYIPVASGSKGHGNEHIIIDDSITQQQQNVLPLQVPQSQNIASSCRNVPHKIHQILSSELQKPKTLKFSNCSTIHEKSKADKQTKPVVSDNLGLTYGSASTSSSLCSTSGNSNYKVNKYYEDLKCSVIQGRKSRKHREVSSQSSNEGISKKDENVLKILARFRLEKEEKQGSSGPPQFDGPTEKRKKVSIEKSDRITRSSPRIIEPTRSASRRNTKAAFKDEPYSKKMKKNSPKDKTLLVLEDTKRSKSRTRGHRVREHIKEVAADNVDEKDNTEQMCDSESSVSFDLNKVPESEMKKGLSTGHRLREHVKEVDADGVGDKNNKEQMCNSTSSALDDYKGVLKSKMEKEQSSITGSVHDQCGSTELKEKLKTYREPNTEVSCEASDAVTELKELERVEIVNSDQVQVKVNINDSADNSSKHIDKTESFVSDNLVAEKEHSFVPPAPEANPETEILLPEVGTCENNSKTLFVPPASEAKPETEIVLPEVGTSEDNSKTEGDVHDATNVENESFLDKPDNDVTSDENKSSQESKNNCEKQYIKQFGREDKTTSNENNACSVEKNDESQSGRVLRTRRASSEVNGNQGKVDSDAAAKVIFSKLHRNKKAVLPPPTGTYLRVRVIPRPWKTPEGTVNRPVLRMMMEGVLLFIMNQPGLTLKALFSKYSPILQPMAVLELIDMLEDLGCVVRRTIQPNSPKPSLFSDRRKFVIDKSNQDEIDENVHLIPTIDCILKMGQFIQQVLQCR